MEVIRIEHPESGFGIFNHNFYDYSLRDFDKRHNRFPIPQEEIELKPHFTQRHYCAYKSIEQLLQWVMLDEFEIIIEKGFKFYSIKATDCHVGQFQAIYTKESIVEKKDITLLFKNKELLELVDPLVI